MVHWYAERGKFIEVWKVGFTHSLLSSNIVEALPTDRSAIETEWKSTESWPAERRSFLTAWFWWEGGEMEIVLINVGVASSYQSWAWSNAHSVRLFISLFIIFSFILICESKALQIGILFLRVGIVQKKRREFEFSNNSMCISTVFVSTRVDLFLLLRNWMRESVSLWILKVKK